VGVKRDRRGLRGRAGRKWLRWAILDTLEAVLNAHGSRQR
jgi:hypothetical protein